MGASAKRLQSAYSGGDDGGLAERVAKLEATAQHIKEGVDTLHSDVRSLLWGGIAGAVLLIGALISGWLVLNSRYEALSDRTLQTLQAQMQAQTQSQAQYQQVSERLGALAQKLAEKDQADTQAKDRTPPRP